MPMRNYPFSLNKFYASYLFFFALMFDNLSLPCFFRERKPKKKKKQREALGVRVTSSESVGGHYLYGNADELLKLQKQAQATSHKSDDMSGFDPVIQTEEYMNEKDNLVHEIDIPERMQVIFCYFGKFRLYSFVVNATIYAVISLDSHGLNYIYHASFIDI